VPLLSKSTFGVRITSTLRLANEIFIMPEVIFPRNLPRFQVLAGITPRFHREGNFLGKFSLSVTLTGTLYPSHEVGMTLQVLASALRSKQANVAAKKKKTPDIPDEKLVGMYTRCAQCGKSLFMDDGLIVDQCPSLEKFMERCTKRLLEHRCHSGSHPQH
jgi:hypothetical protein